MKKNKIYSASDFQNATVSVVVETCKWVIDSIDYTAEGTYSQAPLFVAEMRRLVKAVTDDEYEGYVDASNEMCPTRRYFVHEGHQLYNELYRRYVLADGDKEDFKSYVMKDYGKKFFRGYVEQLAGVLYNVTTKRGSSVQRTRLELWHPDYVEPGSTLNEFIRLCNKGVYAPVVEENTDDDPAKMFAGVDPAKLKALLATLKK